MAGHQLAHVNVARFLRPRSDPANAPFLSALAAVNAAADGGDGLVWRFVADEADEADRRLAADPHSLLNLSVWTDPGALRDFTYRDPLHRAMMRRRREWFDRLEVRLALWWVPAGTRPSLRDAVERLAVLGRLGPTAEAFTFARAFDPTGAAVPS